MGSDPQFEKLLLILFLPFLFMLCHLACWDLSSPTRDQTRALGNESAVLTTGIPGNSLFPFSEWTSWTPFPLLLETTHHRWGGWSLRSCRRLLFQRWRSEVHSLPQWLNGCWRFLEAPGENQVPLLALRGCSRVDTTADGQRQVPRDSLLERSSASRGSAAGQNMLFSEHHDVL